MRNIKKQNKIIRNTFLDSPKLTTSIRQKEIKVSIIQAIHSYNRHTITLEKLIQLIKAVRENNYESLSQNLKEIIDEICSLSVVNDILTDILLELKK